MEYYEATKFVTVMSVVAVLLSLFAIFLSVSSFFFLRKLILDHIAVLAQLHRDR